MLIHAKLLLFVLVMHSMAHCIKDMCKLTNYIVFSAAFLLIRLSFITLFWTSVISYIQNKQSNQCQLNVPNSRSVPHANAMGKKRWQVMLSNTMTTGTLEI